MEKLRAVDGQPNWLEVAALMKEWKPEALIVGLPTCIDDTEQYTTPAARQFAQNLQEKFHLPVHLVDERLSTKEARARLFADGGYRKLKNSSIDSVAAAIILEQWLQFPSSQ